MWGFFGRRDKDSEERWWLEVTGKGEKTRIIPATHELMVELARYRREKGLAPFPTPDEPTPLLLPIGKQTRALTRAAVHAIVKQVFKTAAARIRARGADSDSKPQRVEQAPAHCLRHPAGSHLANTQVALRHARDT